MHSSSSLLLLSLLHLSTSSVIRRQDPGLQSYPGSAPASDSFSNGKPILIGIPDDTSNMPPAVYGARPIDLPFNRLYHGNIKFFPTGQLNTPDKDTDAWGSANDNAEQSACGIPDNAFYNAKVAIHPYFLKYAGLDRYCMQDVCISFWKEDGTSDMMLKVTDICSTDPNDPTHCATPADIKIDRAKAKVMQGLSSDPKGNQYPEKVWWFFMKCWADGLAQPAYQSPSNWFTTPALPNNLKWAQDSATKQYSNNQVAYAAKGWPTYPNGAYNPKRDSETSPPISDWVPGQEPAWSPIAGGKGFSGGSSRTTPSKPNPPTDPQITTGTPTPPYSNGTSSTTADPQTTTTGTTTSPTSNGTSSTTATGSDSASAYGSPSNGTGDSPSIPMSPITPPSNSTPPANDPGAGVFADVNSNKPQPSEEDEYDDEEGECPESSSTTTTGTATSPASNGTSPITATTSDSASAYGSPSNGTGDSPSIPMSPITPPANSTPPATDPGAGVFADVNSNKPQPDEEVDEGECEA
ncbi:hypothetical protein MMC16_005448 [Acarospora aff. strigata]|nr:hypothetical protein [Acarospora aff. strigata]